MNLHDFRQLSAGHALHALSPEDEVAFARALAAHPEWQAVVDEDLETAAEVGDAAPDAAPSDTVRANLLSLIGSMPQVPAVQNSLATPVAATVPGKPREHQPPTQTGRRRALWAGAFALAASVAVLTTVTLGPQIFGPAQDPAELALIEVSQAGDAQDHTVQVAGGGKATLHWSDELDRAVLVTDQLPALPSDQDVEVWLVRGDTPISVGVLAPDEEPAELAGFRPGDVVALTIEAAGGSPSGAPTSDPIAAITTA